MAELTLSYRRVGETYEGNVSVGKDADLTTFTGYTFAQMIRHLHLAVVQLAPTEVVFQRIDRPGMGSVALGAEMLALVRDDPTKYIEMHTTPHRTVDLRDKPSRVSKLAAKFTPPVQTIRAGHETLAAAFGDVMYLAMRAGRIEHPTSGRWCTLSSLADELDLPSVRVVSGDGVEWATIPTAALLAADVPAFFLPRAWNENGPWITKDRLQTRYNDYLKEKNECSKIKAQ